MKVERVISKDVFDYLVNIEAEKFLAEKKRYLHYLFEKSNPKHLELDKDLKNDKLKDIIRDEGMQNLNMDN